MEISIDDVFSVASHSIKIQTIDKIAIKASYVFREIMAFFKFHESQDLQKKYIEQLKNTTQTDL